MRTLSIFSYSLSGTPRACTGGFAMPCLLERSSMSFLKLSMSFRAKSRNLGCFGYAQHDKGAACNMTGFLSFRAKSRNLRCFGYAQHDKGAACNMTGFLSFRAKSRNLGCFGCAQHDKGAACNMTGATYNTTGATYNTTGDCNMINYPKNFSFFYCKLKHFMLK